MSRRDSTSKLAAIACASWLAFGCGDDAGDDDATTVAGGSSSAAVTDTTAASDGTTGTATAGASDSTAPATTDAAEDSTGDPGSGTDAGGSTGAAGCVDYDPWWYDGFEDYAPEQSLSSMSPFDAAGRTAATDEVAFASSMSARMEIRPEDAGGFGQWGGIVPLPDVAQGESVWVRLWVQWPSSFEFSASPWMKFLRLHNRRADGSNGGYNDLYVDNADGPESVLRVIKEVHNVWEVYDGPALPRDTWERYEMQIVVDHVPVDDGGEGRFRVWRDDELIFDRTDVPTVVGEGDVLDYLYIFTYWNNEAPPANTAFIDELAIAVDDAPPPNLDAEGHPFFGDWLPCR